jgi:hypothetical protein
VLLAHVATRVPLGDVAERVNAASALFAALAAGVAGLAFRELVLGLSAAMATGVPRREKRRARKDRAAAEARAPHPLGAGALAAIVTGLLFAFSRTLWGYATVAEVYTLSTLLVASILALVLRWRRAMHPPALPLAAAVAFALGLGVHHVTVALTSPPWPWCAGAATPGGGLSIVPAGCRAGGGPLHSLLLLAARSGPELGHPTSVGACSGT